MKTRRILLFVFMLLLTTSQVACVSWPEHGEGGMAEVHLGTYIPVEVNKAINFEHGLRFDTELLRRQLDTLIVKGAMYCFPATVVQAEHRETRILREIHGGLYFDAANDVLIQRDLLARLERQLDYVLNERTCRPQDNHSNTFTHDNHSGDLGKMLYDLLNSDNQFAENSYQLNPKYIASLAEAAVLLREHKAYRLHIVGHADFTGSDKYNQSLSLQRAQQVSRYLQIMGIESSRISIKALGESLPLYEGSADHIRLVNRRVTIELIESAVLDNSNTALTSLEDEHHD